MKIYLLLLIISLPLVAFGQNNDTVSSVKCCIMSSNDYCISSIDENKMLLIKLKEDAFKNYQRNKIKVEKLGPKVGLEKNIDKEYVLLGQMAEFVKEREYYNGLYDGLKAAIDLYK